MISSSRQFLIKIFVLSLIIYGISALLFTTILKAYCLASFPYLILLIACVTAIGHLWVVKASKQNTMKFSTAYMAVVTLKLMIYLLVMLFFLLYNRSQTIPFVLTFIVFYSLFTIFEVVEILRILKKDSKISL